MSNTIENLELYGLSNSDISVDLGRRFKNYRIALNLTQKEISEQSGVSVMTLVRFESGEFGSISLNKFIALMRALQLLENIADVIPDMPESLYDKQQKRNQRQRASRKRV
ncbi:MAG: helix-turn-helix transcriptional regulator [Bacteroidaceae bacterium]|nr:helix-turn-helix transcriptional regulator [Bacteroidaceae bacterium]